MVLITRSGVFNYDPKYKGATSKPVSSLKEDQELSNDGFLLNHARVLVGSGIETYEKGKLALQTWGYVDLFLCIVRTLNVREILIVKFDCRHFGLNWAFVDPKTPIQSGVKFCVCVKEVLPWVMMPLQVVYVKESRNSKKPIASFSFGSGTLQGHLLVSASLLVISF